MLCLYLDTGTLSFMINKIPNMLQKGYPFLHKHVKTQQQQNKKAK